MKNFIYTCFLCLFIINCSSAQNLIKEIENWNSALLQNKDGISFILETTLIHENGDLHEQLTKYSMAKEISLIESKEASVFVDKNDCFVADHLSKHISQMKIPENFNPMLDFQKYLDMLGRLDSKKLISYSTTNGIKEYAISNLQEFGIKNYRISFDEKTEFLDKVYIELEELIEFGQVSIIEVKVSHLQKDIQLENLQNPFFETKNSRLQAKDSFNSYTFNTVEL